MSEDEGCCLSCLGCLARVPCATLSAWVFMVVSVAACAASLMIGSVRTRKFLEEDEHFMDKINISCICILFIMVFMCTLFLLVSLVSTGRTSKQIFDSSKKNICARVLNVMSILVMVLIQLTWVLLCCLLFIPILAFLLLHLLYKDRDVDCINLKHYGITLEDKEYCGDSLDHLYYKSEEAMICYGIAFICGLLTVISMSCFMSCASANVAYLKEGRFATYNVYRNGMQNSTRGGSVTFVDTKM